MQYLTHPIWKFACKFMNAVAKGPGLARPMNSRLLAPLRSTVFNRYVIGMPDRRYLDNVIIPGLARAGVKRVLSVGCASYTRHNPALLESLGMECWTADIMPENAIWGSPHHHTVCDIADIEKHVPAAHFDAILFSGVMGYGVSGAMMDTVASALHAILQPDGILLIGWNKGRVEDPCTLRAVTSRFTHGSKLNLPARKEIDKSTHVFDWFVKTAIRHDARPERITDAA